MTTVTPFAFEDNLVRVVFIDGEPWFVGKDVCRVLGISKYRDALASLNEDEKRTLSDKPSSDSGRFDSEPSSNSGRFDGEPSSNSGHPSDKPSSSASGLRANTLLINEPGVYRLVFRSRKPQAQRFKRWLAHEVLPALRKTGRYEMPNRRQRTRSDEETGWVSHDGFRELLDGEPLSRTRAKLDMVREARLLFGPHRARDLWSVIGMPIPPADDIEEARAILRERLKKL